MCAKRTSKIPLSERKTCLECAFCEVEKKFETLNLKGEPTLGRCPNYTNKKYCVLLSEQACNKFKIKNGKAETT